MERNLYNNIGDIDMCTTFKLLKVKVPKNFLGTEGFSPRRDGRYLWFKKVVYAFGVSDLVWCHWRTPYEGTNKIYAPQPLTVGFTGGGLLRVYSCSDVVANRL
jgi:hypothetical protein